MITRTSAFAFKGKTEDIRIAEALERRSCSRAASITPVAVSRVTAQLVDMLTVRTGGRSVDREISDTVVRLQDDIAAAIAGALRCSWLRRPSAECQACRHTRRISDTQSHQWQFTPGLPGAAASVWSRRSALDPEFALPHVGLADYHFALATVGGSPSHEAMPRARELAQRALEIDPELPEAHAMLGIVAGHYEYDWERGGAPIPSRRQARAAVSSPSVCGTFFLFATGRADEAVFSCRA